MTDDSGGSLWPQRRDWGRAFEHPEVVRVEILETKVCVLLRSGIELEWPLRPIDRDHNVDEIP